MISERHFRKPADESRKNQSRRYKESHEVKKFEHEEMDKTQGMNAIKLAQTKWKSTIVMKPITNNTTRFFVDCHVLNAVTLRDLHPTTRKDRSVDPLKYGVVFSALGTNPSHWKVEVEDAGSWKTAFTSHHELYRFVSMPFDVKNVVGKFKRVMDVVLPTVEGRCAPVYLAEIVISLNFSKDHIWHLYKVLILPR